MAQLNLGFQIIALVLLLIGLSCAVKIHKEQESHSPQKSENAHKNIMTLAVIFSGLGTVIWTVPNFLLGFALLQTG
ncbi:MAG: hypothetical protein ACYC7D_13385 [Nitrososphaerales archaeon]